VRFCAELEVGPLHNGIDGARLLAEAAVDALGHVNVISAPTYQNILTSANIRNVAASELPSWRCDESMSCDRLRI
jgi:hypothetical protein